MFKLISKGLIILGCFFMSSCADVMKYQFQDYEWGMTLEKAKSKLGRKAKLETSSKHTTLTYKDRVSGRPCRVILLFSPKSKLLAVVRINWRSSSAIRDAKRTIVQQYGEPRPVPKGRLGRSAKKGYFWESMDPDHFIILETGSGFTSLYYYGGKFYRKAKAEMG